MSVFEKLKQKGTRPMFTTQLKTQKAKGVAMLSMQHCNMVHFATIRPPLNVAFMSETSITSQVKFPCFARPCPMKPRHGFVESRLVKNVDELMRVWQEARQADAGAELIIMPRYTGRLSAVAHSAGVVWGKNNDGATAGNGALTIPCPGDREYWEKFTGGNKDIGIESEGWIELVENKSELVAVQLRDGPKMKTNADFVPADKIGMTIERIASPNDLDVSPDHPEALLHWEKYVFSLANVKGIVIALPEKTLASHFAVHGIVANIPVICSADAIARLRVGSQLEGSASAAPLNSEDFKFMAWRIRETKAIDKVFDDGWLLEALGTLHASSIWDNQDHLLRLRANMPVALTRFLAAAALGELRHFSGSFQELGAMDQQYGLTRNSIYEKMFTVPWQDLLKPLNFCASRKGFAESAWRGGSYGGPKWAKIAKTGFRLHCQLELFTRHPTKTRWNNIIKTCNIAVNLAHNGGNVFTKWLPTSHMDIIANCPSAGFLNIAAGEHCLQLSESPKAYAKVNQLVGAFPKSVDGDSSEVRYMITKMKGYPFYEQET